MSNEAREENVARIAADIMFSDEYMNLLERTYSERDGWVDFEANPKSFLIGHGFHVPDAINVLVHDRGELNRPARVDFHWKERVEPARSEQTERPRSEVGAATQELRRLAGVAWDTLSSREMKQLRQDIEASPEARREFESNPKAYAASRQAAIPHELDVIVHVTDQDELRVDLHFNDPNASTQLRGGCCYCGGGECCYYAGDF